MQEEQSEGCSWWNLTQRNHASFLLKRVVTQNLALPSTQRNQKLFCKCLTPSLVVEVFPGAPAALALPFLEWLLSFLEQTLNLTLEQTRSLEQT
jgi:hypothetical protein